MVRSTVFIAIAFISVNAFSQDTVADPVAIMKEIDALADKQLWPGFDPTEYPVAFYTGEETLLFRYPGEPEGFTLQNGSSKIWGFPGRHEMMTANTSTTLGDVSLATVLLDRMTDRSATAIAGITVHELFHVFQRAHHPDWSSNEALLFTYPHENHMILYLRKLENEAMRRALQVDSPDGIERWTLKYLLLRNERFELMPEAHSTYERKSELNEGLARYVESLISGSNMLDSIPEEGWPLTHIRQRTYATGSFLAHMLDRFAPGWKNILEEGETTPLDELLFASFEQREVTAAEFSEKEMAATLESAKSAVDSLESEKLKAREEFLSQDGWKIIIDASGSNLLALRGFDPINVFNIGNGEILHYRMLRLANDQGKLSILGHTSLSFGPNEHPLFHGVRTVTLAGLAEKPEITDEEGSLTVKADGIDISFEGASYSETDDQEITIHLKKVVNDKQDS